MKLLFKGIRAGKSERRKKADGREKAEKVALVVQLAFQLKSVIM